jgi:hypothetical protein
VNDTVFSSFISSHDAIAALDRISEETMSNDSNNNNDDDYLEGGCVRVKGEVSPSLTTHHQINQSITKQ